MPWRVAERDGEVVVVREQDNKVVGRHTSREKALRQLRALYAIEDELAKARSFGGDRSAAGRYAAEQRWKGHVKQERVAPNVHAMVDILKEAQRRVLGSDPLWIAPEGVEGFRELVLTGRDRHPGLAHISDADLRAAVMDGWNVVLGPQTHAPGMPEPEVRIAGMSRGELERWAVTNLIAGWVMSAGSRQAKLLKDATMRMFPEETAGAKDRLKSPIGPAVTAPERVADAVARVLYDKTQQVLKELGYTHVWVYRGTKNQELLRSASQGDTSHPQYRHDSLSSWSLSEQTAAGFTARLGVVAAMKVPVERIFGLPLITTSLSEKEIIVIGGMSPVSIRQVPRADELPVGKSLADAIAGLLKARSFGGDRSAAGRYAAEQRWKGHTPKGQVVAPRNPDELQRALRRQSDEMTFRELPGGGHQMIDGADVVGTVPHPAFGAVSDEELDEALGLILYGAKWLSSRERKELSRAEKETYLIRFLADEWYDDSTSHAAIHLMEAARRVFRDETKDAKGSTPREGYEHLYERSATKVMDAAARFFYETTQQALRELGYTHMYVYRGTRNEDLMRIASDEPVSTEYRHSPLSSWSFSADVGRDFASGAWDARGVVVKMKVPVSRIFMLDKFPLYSPEREVVVLGGTSRVEVFRYEDATRDVLQKSLTDAILDMLKARSFGGDRSAAGRYAAEQRWKGHIPKGRIAPANLTTFDEIGAATKRWAVKVVREGLATAETEGYTLTGPDMVRQAAAFDVARSEAFRSLPRELLVRVTRQLLAEDVNGQALQSYVTDMVTDDDWETAPRSRLVEILMVATLGSWTLSTHGMGAALLRDAARLEFPDETDGAKSRKMGLGAWDGWGQKGPDESHLHVARLLVREVHRIQQEVLKEAGIAGLVVLRGTTNKELKAVLDAGGRDATYRHEALSSWSLSSRVAYGFARGSTVVAALVPASRIFMLGGMMIAYEQEYEAIVLGGKSKVKLFGESDSFTQQFDESVFKNAHTRSLSDAILDMLKVKSFGGDRSAAGRYAASIRWQGHTPKGRDPKRRDAKARMEEAARLGRRAGELMEAMHKSPEFVMTMGDQRRHPLAPATVLDEFVEMARELEQIGAELMRLADEALVADGVFTAERLAANDAANARVQERASMVNALVREISEGAETVVIDGEVVDLRTIPEWVEFNHHAKNLWAFTRQAHEGSVDGSRFTDSELQSMWTMYGLSLAALRSVLNARMKPSEMLRGVLTAHESAEAVAIQQYRFAEIRKMLGEDKFGPSQYIVDGLPVTKTTASGTVEMSGTDKFTSRGWKPDREQNTRGVLDGLKLLPGRVFRSFSLQQVSLDAGDDEAAYIPSTDSMQLPGAVRGSNAFKGSGFFSKGLVAHETTHYFSFKDYATRVLELAVRQMRTGQGENPIASLGQERGLMRAWGDFFGVTDDFMDTYSGRMYPSDRRIVSISGAGRGRVAVPVFGNMATEVLTTGVEYATGYGRTQFGIDVGLANVAIGWMAGLINRQD